MPRLIVTPGALAGIARCREHLRERNEGAAGRAAAEIERRLFMLEHRPEIGRPATAGLRELPIRFGRSGYIALYHVNTADDLVVVVAFRHQREAGY